MNRKPRVGIERKILTSILWVGILPMAVVLIAGYGTARIGASNAVRETLEVSVRKTVEGAERDMAARLGMATRLASESSVLGALSSSSEGQAPDAMPSVDMAPLAAWIAGQAVAGEDIVSVLSLYDSSGRLVFTPDTQAPPDTLMPVSYPRDPLEAQFCAFDLSSRDYTGTVIAPVRREGSEELLGYLTIRSGINSLLEFALREEADSSKAQDSYQVLLMLPTGSPMVSRLRQDVDNPSIEAYPADESLWQRLSEHPEPSGWFRVSDYRFGDEDEPQDVLMAFQSLSTLRIGNRDIFLTVFRPTRDVYSGINQVALLALVGCILFIAVLCLNAYRDVHNNIVRPVSLLNEGAQIIRQGDFDLKLKIDTGDEIEELASSFNKMAQALSHNVQQLETSEERHRNLVTSIRDGIYQTDRAGLITFLNPAGVAILGFDSVEQAISKNLRHMFIEPIYFDPMAADPKTQESQERSRFWMKRWDDQTICVELSRNRLSDES
ncbi:MAG: HAMP domain-containing protein, partial [Candidatus Hydrogenedentes bacterium]|nr:HAMP domain-containing protein [Candidatus Hydrogenedentota bacterium]